MEVSFGGLVGIGAVTVFRLMRKAYSRMPKGGQPISDKANMTSAPRTSVRQANSQKALEDRPSSFKKLCNNSVTVSKANCSEESNPLSKRSAPTEVFKHCL